MQPFEQIKKTWDQGKNLEIPPAHLDGESFEKVIKVKIKKEKKIIAEYFWAALTYQILVYSFMSYLILTFWGDAEMMAVGFAGAILYLPFTIIFMKKYKGMYTSLGDSSVQDIQTHVKNKYDRLSEFFRFKKRFDWFGIPLSCFIIVAAIFKLFVEGGLEEHLVGGLIVYILYLSIFIAAMYSENKKRFEDPLRHLALILKDLEQ